VDQSIHLRHSKNLGVLFPSVSTDNKNPLINNRNKTTVFHVKCGGRGILVVVNNQVFWFLEPEDEGNTFRRMIGKYTAIKNGEHLTRLESLKIFS
jgi:hypothetical protein